MSFLLIWPSYNLVYYFASLKARAEIMGKMNPGMASDDVRKSILEYKKRDREGLVERYEGSKIQEELGGEALFENKGVYKKPVADGQSSFEEFRVSSSFNRNQRR